VPTPGRGPTREQLLACAGATLEPVVGPDLDVLFCGINPGLYTAWAGHHFARPGNRFWPCLFASGLTPRLLAPAEQDELPSLGLGITNVVGRATARAAELSPEELRAGGRDLVAFVQRWRPAYLAVLGVTAYRVAFEQPRAAVGAQHGTIGGSRLWVLPNPSGLNAHETPASLAERFAELRAVVSAERSGDAR
jgi:TDG/mug DNA glycosylase family protein